jgi:menaquinone-dependent protoporphyrinogen oxidase
MKETTKPKSKLVGYATRSGSTRDVRSVEGYRAVVLGAPLFMYRWNADALHFRSKCRIALADLPVAVFALGPTHDPHDKVEWGESRSRFDKALARYAWLKPAAMEIFGGKFDPKDLRFPLNKLAGSEPASDIRDTQAVRAWAAKILPMLAG